MPLSSTVTVLPLPQTAGAFEARALYRAGNFSATVAALRGANSTEAVVLRGRAELRRGELTRALADFETARRATMRQQEAHRERAEVAMLLGTTLARLEREDEAEAAYIDARAYAWSTTDANLHAELEYYLALTAWSRRDLTSAERHIANVLRLGSTAEQIRGHELAAYVHGAREAYGEQAAELTKAFELLEESPDHEVIVEASVLFNLSILAREMYLPGLAARIEERVDNVQWTTDLGRFQYLATMELGWARALAGDALGGYRLLRRTPDLAPNAAWKAHSFADMATLAVNMGERGFAHDDLTAAAEAAAQVPWDDIRGEERVALLGLARVVSAEDPERAAALLERYGAIKRRISPLLAYRADRRLVATEADARGVVAKAQGDTRRAIGLFADAFDIWKSIDYRWRATRTAFELYELTGEARFAQYAAYGASSYPQSWLARTAAATLPETQSRIVTDTANVTTLQPAFANRSSDAAEVVLLPSAAVTDLNAYRQRHSKQQPA